MGESQPFLFPELETQQRPTRPRPPKLYAKAVARRHLIEKMTRKGALLREIAAKANCTVQHVLRVRADLRAMGRLPETDRAKKRYEDTI